MSKRQIIRGARIEQQLNQLDEASYAELERNTMSFVPPSEKRQWVVDPIQVTRMELAAARESQNLIIKAEVSSNGNRYAPSMVFDGVIYDDGDQADNTSFTGADGEEYHIEPINLSQNNVKVACNCLDFYWRFATWNHGANSLNGNPPPPYQKRSPNHPPANPQKKPGLCKHLLKMAIALKDARIVR